MKSSIEDDQIEFVLPADREYSTSFELNTTCGITSNISSSTFSEELNVCIMLVLIDKFSVWFL